ncbi:MAG: hypothetical protein SGILL_005726, partial [Bacillariaceae sp.]
MWMDILLLDTTSPSTLCERVPNSESCLSQSFSGDSVTIASSEELLDACEQYVGQKVLRITTYVKPKTTIPPLSTACAGAPAQSDEQQPTSVDRGTSTTTTTTPSPPSPPIQIQDVLESFVGVVATAVNHLQEATKTPRPSVPSTSAGAKPKATEVESGDAKTDRSTSKASEEKTANEEDEKEDSKPVAQEEAGSGKEVEEAQRSFIHGRHTCDSCLSTPIFGTRYHATNLKDYDLCEGCFKNYKGTEIILEPSELERDRAAQDRWYRRWENSRMGLAMSRRGRFGRPGGPRGRCGRPGNRPGRPGRFSHGPTPPPPPHHVARPPPPPAALKCPPPPPPVGHVPSHPFGLPPHMGPGGFHHHHHLAHLGPHVAPHVQTPTSGLASEFDNALKEAIRRSLSEIAHKEANIEQPADEVPMPSAPIKDDVATENQSNTIETTIAAGETKTSPEEKEKSFPNSQDAETPTVAVDDIPRSVEIVNTEEDCADQTEAMEKSMYETESVDSEKLAAEGEDAPSTPSSVPSRSSTSSHKVSDSSKDESFASDAKGNGDVAEAMGAALDAVAGVIREMQEDAKSVDEAAVDSGELIVNSSEINQDANSKSDESEWSVVESVGSNGTTESEQIAKAAEMLGSALFNSDMKNSSDDIGAENESDVVGSVAGSSFSVPSSVPTDIGTQ